MDDFPKYDTYRNAFSGFSQITTGTLTDDQITSVQKSPSLALFPFFFLSQCPILPQTRSNSKRNLPDVPNPFFPDVFPPSLRSFQDQKQGPPAAGSAAQVDGMLKPELGEVWTALKTAVSAGQGW